MSRAYGYGLINSKLNTLQSLVLTSGSSSQGLESVLSVNNDAGQLAATNFSYISSKTTDNISEAKVSGDDGFMHGTDTSQVTIYATNQCIIDLRADTNQGYITTDPTQMVIQTADAPLNLVNKGIKLDGADGAAGQCLTSGGVGYASTWTTQNLEAVLTAGNTSYTPLVINSPTSLFTSQINSDTIIVSDGEIESAVHQLDGFVAGVYAGPSSGDYGQLLKDKVIFSKSGHVSEIKNTTTAMEITSSDININGQASFNTPPHSVDAVNGNDLVTKGYVDSLVGQYSGGYNFFMNYSVVDGVYRSLGQSVVAAVQQALITTTDGTNQVVAQFVTSALGVTSIPSGIWNVLLYSEVTAPAGILNYFFELYKLTGATETLIATSGFSPDVNATSVPTAYPINATISAPYPVALTDKIVLRIYVHKDGTPVNVTTFFQDEYYSFTQSTLNAGTTLLSSNNTWTGSNTFTQTTACTGELTVKDQLALTSNSYAANTSYVDNAISTLESEFVSGPNVWTGTQNFTGAALTALTQASNINTTAVATTQWANTFYAPKASPTFTGTVTLATDLRCATAASALSLFTTSTSGQVDILTSTSRTGTTNIQTSAPSANQVNIGSSFTTTNIKGILKNNELTTDAVGDNLAICNGLSKSGTLSIMAASTVANTVEIGSATTTTNIRGLTSSSIATTAVGTAMTLYTANTGGQCDILTAGARTAATNMLTGTSANTFTIGSGTAGLTFTLRGLAATFESATNSFTNAIKGTGTANLLVGAPIQPSSITYNASTGTIQSTAIGYRLTGTATNFTGGIANSIGTIGSLSTIPAGVYIVECSCILSSLSTPFCTISISQNAAIDVTRAVNIATTTTAVYGRVTAVVCIPADNGAVNFTAQSSTASVSITSLNFTRTRIA